MDFELTERQKKIQEQARDFALREFSMEKASELDESYTYPYEIWKKACQSGFIGIHFPEAYGGQGCGITENILIVEEFCRKDSGVGISLSLADFSSELVLRFGTAEQKKKYLIPVAQGQFISAGAYTEPDHGSDITLLSTTARKERGAFLINGTKTFISNGTIAYFFIVLCQTDSEAKPSYRGQCTLIADKGTKGFEATEIMPKMGIRMTSTAELSFSDVTIPASHLLGA